jgi:hypothetical protein
MPNARQDLIIRVFDTYTESTRVLQADLSENWTRLTFSTVQHGGFKDCQLSVPMSLDTLWLSLRSEQRGWHYYHLEVTEDHRTVWEGRIVKVGMSFGRAGPQLELLALGYWSSLRDQFYDAADAGNTDWTAGGPHTVNDVIKEMLNDEGPDINSDQGNIDSNARDVVGLDLTARDYPQNIIVERLGPLSDSDDKEYFFAIWEDRIPYWKPKAVTQVDWFVFLEAIEQGRLEQDGTELRNSVLPVKDSVEGTSAADSDSQVLYPVREVKTTVAKGVGASPENDQRDAVLADRKAPRQSQRLTISGRVLSTATSDIGAAPGAMVDRPKWWMRAGEVIRVQDLVPASVASPAFDDLRTFWIRETTYDAGRDVLTIQPDSPSRSLSAILPRLGQIERDR